MKSVNNWKDIIKPNKAKIIVTIIFFVFLILGFFGFPPFGKETYGRGQDINPVLIAPIYLLKGMELNSLLMPTLIILIYYYLIACILVWAYKKIKKSK